MKPILFFTDDIAINVHSATEAENVGKILTVEQFCGTYRASLHIQPNGDLKLFKRITGYNDPFIEGKEV
jgi:hypothetical protein